MSDAHGSGVSLARARALIVVAYAVATLVGIAAAWLVPSRDTLCLAAVADVAATVAIFVFSIVYRNSSFYDAYWSVLPPFVGVYWLLVAPSGVDRLRQALALGLCTIWGVRLTYNWARGWTGLGHEDWRYVEIAKKTGKLYWPVSFLGIHMFPTFQTFAGSIGLYFALVTPGRPFGVLDVLATLVTAGAIACEAIADQQLHEFVRRPGKRAGETIREGLWAYSRHPNYFGEMMFWWGLFLFGMAAAPERFSWMIVGPAAITIMFVFVSVPLMEKRQLERKPEYAEVVRTTSMIVPWFRKSA